MRSTFPRLVLASLVGTCLAGVVHAGDGVIDLTALANYANQPRPTYITLDNTTTNPLGDAGATLGRVLFYDKRLSTNDTISCASCHQQERAFSDTAVASTGVAGTTGRHSMRLINARFSEEPRFFWDERAATLEAQTTQPIQDHVEMGFSGLNGSPTFAALVTKLSAIAEYRVLFALTFGTAGITETRLQRALAQFVRSIQSFDSRYDTGRALAGADVPNFSNFTAAENAGKQLFLTGPPGGAGCAVCHVPPGFDIDRNSRNNGVITAIGGGTDLTNTRSPTLRDLLRPDGQTNGAFMHDGSFATLARVIDHYNAIPGDNANLDNRLRRPGGVQNLGLTQTQKDNLVAFLRTLTGNAVYTEAKWSDPFTAQGQLTAVVFAPETASIQANDNGTATISGRAVAGFSYQLQSSTDLTNWTAVTTVIPTSNGLCTATVPFAACTFYRYAYVVPTT